MIKIISKKHYDELVRLLKEALPLMKSLKKECDDYEKKCLYLQGENIRLKELLHRHGISYLTTNVDFPATEKLHEDKIF